MKLMPPLLKFFGLSICALLSGLAVYNNGMARLYVQENPDQALARLPRYSQAHLEVFKQSIQTDKKNFTKESRADLASSVLRQDPLSDTVFSEIARAQMIATNDFADRPLYDKAVVRNPHNRFALENIATLLVYSPSPKDAIPYIDQLTKVNKNFKKQAAWLAELGNTDQGAKTIIKLLSGHPKWGRDVLKQQISTMTPSNQTRVGEALKQYSNSGKFDWRINHLHQAFSKKLFLTGSYQFAHQYWKTSHSDATVYGKNHVHDANFEGSQAPPPFNWRFLKTSKHFVEIDNDQSVFASFGHDRPTVMALQTLALSPSQKYSLNIDADWDYDQRQGKYWWQIQCLPSQEIIAKTIMDDANAKQKLLSIAFETHKNGCELQTLKLLASPGQYKKRITAKFKSVTIHELAP